MRHARWMMCCSFFLVALTLQGTAHADVTDPTPHDYGFVPRPGWEEGTYAGQASGSLGPDCHYTVIGTAKLLPNDDGTGGKHCFIGSIEVDGTGPACALAPVLESRQTVIGGTYTYNGDGTLCEDLRVIGGPLDGTPTNFHTYVAPFGTWIMLGNQDIAYACPGIPANGAAIGQGLGLKIGRHGDEPPGSGELPCP